MVVWLVRTDDTATLFELFPRQEFKVSSQNSATFPAAKLELEILKHSDLTIKTTAC